MRNYVKVADRPGHVPKAPKHPKPPEPRWGPPPLPRTPGVATRWHPHGTLPEAIRVELVTRRGTR